MIYRKIAQSLNYPSVISHLYGLIRFILNAHSKCFSETNKIYRIKI